MPTERPMLFNDAMVRAVLSGQKTVTRRLVKPGLVDRFDPPRGQADVDAGYPFVECEDGYISAVKICPYGQPGDRLYVRESLRYDPEYGHYYSAGGKHGDTVYLCSLFDDQEAQTGYSYDGLLPERSVPSIHLHRRYSRILLEITAVRVERLHAITNDQCIAEGCSGGHGSIPGYIYNATPQEHFRHIWESTGGDYRANPWVWVIEFKRVTL